MCAEEPRGHSDEFLTEYWRLNVIEFQSISSHSDIDKYILPAVTHVNPSTFMPVNITDVFDKAIMLG